MKNLLLLFPVFVCLPVFAQDQKGLLIENFNDNKLDWPVRSTETVNWKVENGLYYRESLKDFAYTTLKPVDLDPVGDYWVYLGAKHLGGITDQGYGLSFGARDNQNEFTFVVASSGHYDIYKRENGKITELVKWTETDALVRSDNYTNSLWLEKKGNDWRFKINGKFVYSMSAQPLFGYNFGVTTSGTQTIGFDELNVNQLLEHTSPPVRTIVKDTVLFKEDFSNNQQRWAQYAETEGSAAVKDGKYILDHKSNLVDFSLQPVYINEYQDFSISVNTAIYAKGDSSEYGLCFGFKDVNNYYAFILTREGIFDVYRMQAGVFKFLVRTAASEAIKKEEKAMNKLTLKQEGKSWKFFINDKLVSSMPSESFYGDRIGVETGGRQGGEFDDIEVKQINITRFYKTKLCLIEKGVLKEIDAEESEYDIVATVNGKKQTWGKYSNPDFSGYAARQPWFEKNEMIQFKGMSFSKSGYVTTLGIHEIKKLGEYKTVGVYMSKDASFDSSAMIYVPVRPGCDNWQAYAINCPEFTLNALAMVPINDTVTFTADVTGLKNTKYNWTVSDGKIVSGQGTRVIQVSTAGMVTRSVLDVSVELNPRLPGCENKKSKTVRVGARPVQGGRPQRTRN